MSQADIDVVNSIAELYRALRAERDAALAELAAVRAERDAAVEALKAVEWVPVYQQVRGDSTHTWYGCPSCRMDREYNKHAANCQLAAALQVRA